MCAGWLRATPRAIVPVCVSTRLHARVHPQPRRPYCVQRCPRPLLHPNTTHPPPTTSTVLTVHIGPDANANTVLQQLEQCVRGVGIQHSTIQICNPLQPSS